MRSRIARLDGRIAMAVVVVAIFVLALAETQQMSARARLFPFATAIPGLAIAVVALVRELRSEHRPIPPEAATTLRALLHFAAYFAGTFVIGFLPTTALFTALYLWREAELPWWGAILGSAAGTGGIFVFAQTLHIPLPEGILQGLFPV